MQREIPIYYDLGLFLCVGLAMILFGNKNIAQQLNCFALGTHGDITDKKSDGAGNMSDHTGCEETLMLAELIWKRKRRRTVK